MTVIESSFIDAIFDHWKTLSSNPLKVELTKYTLELTTLGTKTKSITYLELNQWSSPNQQIQKVLYNLLVESTSM